MPSGIKIKILFKIKSFQWDGVMLSHAHCPSGETKVKNTVKITAVILHLQFVMCETLGQVCQYYILT